MLDSRKQGFGTFQHFHSSAPMRGAGTWPRVPPVDPAHPMDPALDPRPALSKHGCSFGTWHLELPAAVRLYQAAPEPQTAAASPHRIYASMAKNLLENQHFACKPPLRSSRPIWVTRALRVRTVGQRNLRL